MISSVISASFFLFTLKSFIFFSSFFHFDSMILFMLSIFPLVFFLIVSILFNFSNVLDSYIYKLIFFSVGFSLVFCFSSIISFLFLLGLESCVIFMMILIFFFSKDIDKISSSIFMFTLNIMGSIPFMFFCSDASKSLLALNFSSCWILSIPIFFCFLLILSSKLPIFFFHFWLTKAHVSASGSGSMLLASLMLKIGSFGMLKFSSFFLGSIFNSLKLFSLDFSLFTCLSLILVMNRFFDLKYVVACSSIVHMSLILPFCLFFSSMGVLSCMLMMVSHGIISCFIFFIVTLIYEFSFNRSSDFNKSLESFSKPLVFFFFFFLSYEFSVSPFRFLC